MEHLNQKIRVAISENNPSIKRFEERCIRCGQCARICDEMMSVNNHYKLEETGQNPICVHCGQCVKVCPTDSLVGKDEYKEIKRLMNDKSKVFIVSTSPSVRVALGDEFGLEKGSFVQGKMVALLRKLGFNFVLDTNFSADLTICEEATELISRVKNGDKPMPQFTSCCPAWVRFVEYFYPELIGNISTCKSPIGMQGPIIKTYFAKKMGIDPQNIVNVALTPCVAKKAEIRREEMNSSAKFNNQASLRDMDFVVTTEELSRWAKEENVDFNSLQDDDFDDFMGSASGAGVIFGNTGGVMEAAIRTAYSYLSGKLPEELFFELTAVRGFDGLREAVVDLGVAKIKVAVVFGLANARKLIEKIKNGEKYDFVEVMTCPGGCIGGGGQPKHIGREQEAQKKRIEALYQRDKSMKCRASHLNPQIIALYEEFLEGPNKKLALELLHTMYKDRSDELGQSEESQELERMSVTTDASGKKMIKYRCKICGAVFEVEEGESFSCPVCGVGSELCEIIEGN